MPWKGFYKESKVWMDYPQNKFKFWWCYPKAFVKFHWYSFRNWLGL